MATPSKPGPDYDLHRRSLAMALNMIRHPWMIDLQVQDPPEFHLYYDNLDHTLIMDPDLVLHAIEQKWMVPVDAAGRVYVADEIALRAAVQELVRP